jgi:hypothetical protein
MQDRQWVDEEFELIVSSDADNGAQQITQEGSKFSIDFDEPLGLPRGAINPTVQCMGASIWWTIPNIIASGTKQNNLFGFTYTRNPVGTATTVRIDVNNSTFQCRYNGVLHVMRVPYPQDYTFDDLLFYMRAEMVTATGTSLAEMITFFTMALTPVTNEVVITVDVRGMSSDTWGFVGWSQGTGFQTFLGYADLDTFAVSNVGSSNLIPPVNGVSKYDSPYPSVFGSSIITKSGLSIPEGLYNIDQLGAIIKQVMSVNGLTEEEANSFIALDVDNSTQLTKIYMSCPYAAPFVTAPYAFEFGVAGQRGFDAVLGFDDWPIPGIPGPDKKLLGNTPFPGGGGLYTFTASNIAAFNSVNYLLLHTDLVPRGIRFNGNFNQIVAQVLVDVGAGQQIVYAPFNPPICDAANLVGAQRTTAQFWLTDDTNNPVNTFGETWSMRLVFKYKIAR